MPKLNTKSFFKYLYVVYERKLIQNAVKMAKSSIME